MYDRGCPKFCLWKQTCVLSRPVRPDSLWPHGLQPARLLCPCGFSRRENWSGLPCPPPENLPSPGSNSGLPHWRQILYHLSYQQSPLRLNELLGYNTHPIGLVSPWSETPENFLFCLCVCVSFPLSLIPTPNPVWGCMEKPSWEETVLTRILPC